MPRIHVIKDKTEDYKEPADPWSLPLRLLICGKSDLSGKTNLVSNLICFPHFYANHFKPENTYLISGTAYSDNKWRMIIDEIRKIPRDNIYTDVDEDELQALLEKLKQKYLRELTKENPNPDHSLIIFDDVGFSGKLKGKKFGVVTEIACNSRHELISMIVCVQDYTQCSTAIRRNLTGFLISSCEQSSYELFERDNYRGVISKKDFQKLYYTITDEPYQFFGVSYKSKSKGNRWSLLDNNLEHIDLTPYKVHKK